MNTNNPNLVRVEIETLEEVQARLAVAGATWHDVVIQGVDLTGIDEALGQAPIAGCCFLGCEVGPRVAQAIAKSEEEADHHKQCLVFPRMPWLPFNPYRGELYGAEELLGRFTTTDVETEKAVYEASVDWKSYLTFADVKDGFKLFTNDSVDTILARRLHDTSISDALEDLLAPIRAGKPGTKKGVVAVMGGHDMERRDRRRVWRLGGLTGKG